MARISYAKKKRKEKAPTLTSVLRTRSCGPLANNRDVPLSILPHVLSFSFLFLPPSVRILTFSACAWTTCNTILFFCDGFVQVSHDVHEGGVRPRACSQGGGTGRLGDHVAQYSGLYGVVWHGILCYAMLCYAMVWYAMLCYAMLWVEPGIDVTLPYIYPPIRYDISIVLVVMFFCPVYDII